MKFDELHIREKGRRGLNLLELLRGSNNKNYIYLKITMM